MRGFKTKNSIYYVDTVNCLIWGGKLGNSARRYTVYKMIVGLPGYFEFVGGGSITTGIIQKYI